MTQGFNKKDSCVILNYTLLLKYYTEKEKRGKWLSG